MSTSPETILVAFGLFLVLWYLGASIFNRQRGITIFRWLQAGLEPLGGEVSARWLGSSSSGAQITIQKAKPPFRQIEIICLMAARELLPLFLINLLRGKRDQLIVKFTLRSMPQGEAEVTRARSPQARQLRNESKTPWQVEELPHGLVLGIRGRDGETLRSALMPLLQKHGPRIQSVSWSKQAPHLIIVVMLNGLYQAGGSAADLYGELADVANAVVTKSEK
jgi:hypothetical protein